MESAKVFTPLKSKYLLITAEYIVPFLISFTIIFFGYLAMYSDLFKIHDIDCQLDFETCQNESLLAEIEKYKGQNIFKFQSNILSARLLSGDFTIREANIKKILPNNLVVELQSVYPVVALKLQDDDRWVVMDSSFRVITTRTTDPNVPTLIITNAVTLSLGKPPDDPNLLASLSLTKRLSDSLASLKSIKQVDKSTLELALDSGVKVLMSSQKDEIVQIRALQAILSEATISKGVKIIDVRFSQPVLR